MSKLTPSIKKRLTTKNSWIYLKGLMISTRMDAFLFQTKKVKKNRGDYSRSSRRASTAALLVLTNHPMDMSL